MTREDWLRLIFTARNMEGKSQGAVEDAIYRSQTGRERVGNERDINNSYLVARGYSTAHENILASAILQHLLAENALGDNHEQIFGQLKDLGKITTYYFNKHRIELGNLYERRAILVAVLKARGI